MTLCGDFVGKPRCRRARQVQDHGYTQNIHRTCEAKGLTARRGVDRIWADFSATNATFEAEWIRRPVSRVLCRPPSRADATIIPLDRPLPDGSRDLPGHLGPATALPASRPARRPYLVLLQAGLAMPSRSPGPRWALTPPFHPCPPAEARRAVCFLWRYPWGHPRRALPAALSPWSPDFPPPALAERRATARPSDPRQP